MRRVLLLLPFAITFAFAAGPDRGAPVPTDVVAVVSGGYWKTTNGRGTFRVVIRNSGYEHASSEAVAEWIAEAPSPAEAPRLLHWIQLLAPGMLSLESPVLERRANSVRVTLGGVDAHRPAVTVRCVFDLTADGLFNVIQPCTSHET
jgi:hypothetical protein